jgi:hypothetical protein
MCWKSQCEWIVDFHQRFSHPLTSSDISQTTPHRKLLSGVILSQLISALIWSVKVIDLTTNLKSAFSRETNHSDR